MKTRLVRTLALVVLLAGGCINGIENPACPHAVLVSVGEDDAPDAYEALGAAHAQRMVVLARDAALSDAALELDVVEIRDVEYVERSPACTSDLGHRARALVDVHTADGSFSVRVPGLVAQSDEDGAVTISFVSGEVALEGTQVPEIDRPEGSVVAALDLEVEDGVVTLVRTDMASSCTDIATCTSTERVSVVSWSTPAPDFEMWFDEI